VSSQRVTLTVPEAAELLGVGRTTLYELVRAGKFPAVRLGRRILIPRRALDEVLAGAPLPVSAPDVLESTGLAVWPGYPDARALHTAVGR
jgi:excisionase family DNA binding protein